MTLLPPSLPPFSLPPQVPLEFVAAQTRPQTSGGPIALGGSPGLLISQRNNPTPIGPQQLPQQPPQQLPRLPQPDSGYLRRSPPSPDIPQTTFLTETRLLGMPLVTAPAVVDLSAIRGLLPEAPLLMLPVSSWQVVAGSSFANPANPSARGTLEIIGSGVAQPPMTGQAAISATALGIGPDGQVILLGESLPSGDDFGITVVDGGGTETQNLFITSESPGDIDVLPPGLQTDPFFPSGPGVLATLPGDSQTTSAPLPSGGVDTPPLPTPAAIGGFPNEPDTAAPLGSEAIGPDSLDPLTPQPSTDPAQAAGTTAVNTTDVNTTDANTPTAALDCPQEVAQLRQTKASDRQASVYKALINCFEQNLDIATRSANRNLQLYALNNLGSSYFVVGDYLRAIAAHEQQLAAAQITGDRTHIGIALAGLGAAQAALGDYDAAIAHYRRSLSQLPPDKALQWRGLALRNLGNAYLSKKDYAQALSYQNQSLALSRQIKDTYGEMQSLGNLGNAYSLDAQFDAALAAYEPSLALSQRLGAELEEAQTLLGMATTYAYQKRYEPAIAYGQQSLSLLQQLENRLGQGIALTNLGDAQYQTGQLAPAEASFRQGVQIWESLRAGLGNNDAYKVSIFETQSAAYRNLQEVLAEQNKVGEALEMAERGRGRAFLELLARGNAQGRRQSEAAAIAPPRLADLQRIARDQDATLVAYTLAQAQFVEVPYGASVQYASEPVDSKLLIWVVNPSGQVDLRQVDLQEATPQTSLQQIVQIARRCMNDAFCIRQAQRQTRFGFTAPESDSLILPEPSAPAVAGPTATNNPLQQLHQLLIDPIADLLPRSAEAKVIFIPQDHLFLVPFPALQAADGSYLIDRHTVMTSPSIQLLAATRARREQLGDRPGSALIVGNPAPMPRSFAPLPFTEAEARTVSDLLGGSALVGAQATEATVKQQLGQAATVHLATHGLFDAAKPLAGAIALVAGDGEDGLLTAGEILSSRLQARLVVLSACDTGRGRITGDGVIGLSRSFLAAGASSVMVSLWQVPDDATAVLMTEFHRNSQQDGNNAQALRQAMLTVKQRYGDPKAWSGFTLVGES